MKLFVLLSIGLSVGVAGAVGSVSQSIQPPASSTAKRDDVTSSPVTRDFDGRVVSLVEALKKRGLSSDMEATRDQFVLLSDDGRIHPILRDDASRALFLDERLRNRAARLTARVHSGVPYLQVVLFRIEESSRFRVPEYWCEVCSIAVRFPQTCPCCQGSMELRMKPEDKD